MQNKKGFTIIELLVVIAIIAVLAAIVLVNVTQYISKGKNAAIEGNMATLLTNGAVYFDDNPSDYGDDFIADALGCSDTGPIDNAIENAYGSDDLTCQGKTDTQEWCGHAATLAVGSTAASTFCVDSTGYKGVLITGSCDGVADANGFICQ